MNEPRIIDVLKIFGWISLLISAASFVGCIVTSESEVALAFAIGCAISGVLMLAVATGLSLLFKIAHK